MGSRAVCRGLGFMLASSCDIQLWPRHFHPTALCEVLLDHPSSPDFWRALSPFPTAPSHPDRSGEQRRQMLARQPP